MGARIALWSAVALAVVVPALAAAAPNAASCDAAGIAAATLAPQGGVPSDWIGELSPRLLAFQVLADFSYAKDFVAGTRRKDVAPCLKSWGAKDVVRINATSSLGADISALVLRTDNDVFVSFRGMDSRRDVTDLEAVAGADFSADYFGPNVTAIVSKAGAPQKLPDGRANPDAFWTLEGYQDAFEAIRGPVEAQVAAWAPRLAPGHRTWYVGHSDGSQLAQLAALWHASHAGPERVGGVVLFGPSRVGSRGFAAAVDALLPGRVAYFAYGRDPAAASMFVVGDGLRFPGVGLYACPVQGKAAESLVVVPAGEDHMDVCSELKPGNSPLARVVLPDWVFDTSDPTVDHLSNWEYLANHIPANTYDGLLRLLGSRADGCTLAAMGLPQCVVSTKCSTALRPADASKCRGCASDATCRSYWGMPFARCDRSFVELSGWQCYNWVPGTQANLYLGQNGAPKTLADVLPDMPQLRGFGAGSSSRSGPRVGH